VASKKTVVADLESAICVYLKRYPGAKDSVAGVAQWCARITGASQAVEPVQQALDALVARGQVNATVLIDGNTIYHLPSNP
jgi:hypothetical protein